MEQLSLFEMMKPESDFPCDDCIFDEEGGCCGHLEDATFYCVNGSFRVRHRSTICPECGREMEVRQSDYGSDWAQCKCGLTKIFNNQGNRQSLLDMYMKMKEAHKDE